MSKLGCRTTPWLALVAAMVLFPQTVQAQPGAGPFGQFPPGQPGTGMGPGPSMMTPPSFLGGGPQSPEIGRRLNHIMVLKALVGGGFGQKETADALPPLRALLKAEQELKERTLKVLDAEKARLLAATAAAHDERPVHEQMRAEQDKFREVQVRTWNSLRQAVGPPRTELLRRLLGQAPMVMPGQPGAPQGFPGFGPGFPGAPGAPEPPAEGRGDLLGYNPSAPDAEHQVFADGQARPAQPRRPGQPGAQPQRPGFPGQPGFGQPGFPGQPGFGQPGQFPMPLPMMGPHTSLEDLVTLLEARLAALRK